MKETKTEFYSLAYWDDKTNSFHELCCGDDLEALTNAFQRVREKDKSLSLRLNKVVHIEKDFSETILSS